MRVVSALAPLLLAATAAHAASVRRQAAIQCPATDKAGTPFTSSVGDGDLISCSYVGAGACEYVPADGSLSSGSPDCPVGVAQDDPSVTTDAVSSADPAATGTGTDSAPLSSTTDDSGDDDSSTSASAPTSVSAPLSTPKPSATSSGGLAGAPATRSTPAASAPSTSPSSNSNEGTRSVVGVASGAPGVVLALGLLALGMGVLL
ncbi:hypothetical protein C8R46DRAFT_1088659 [Mycena filopes]|nr:hypothetical protein C8R46DRAFT_1088659 [Mycena filopes]